MKKLTILTLLLLLVAILMAEPMPDFRLPDESGKNVSLSELLGRDLLSLIFGQIIVSPANKLCQLYKNWLISMIA